MKLTVVSPRTVRLTLVAGLAALTTVLALLVAEQAAQAHSTPPARQVSTRALALHTAMDRLWEDHVVWTRMVIVDFAAGLPDLKAAEVRLLRNQTDIGNAIKPFYGAAAGNRLTALLRTHILEAVPVLAAAKAGDQAKLATAMKAWHANARQIAAFLSRANPRSWPLAMMTSLMTRHRQLTTAEAVARLHGHWNADVAAYDAVRAEILGMSQMLGDGIVRQFPEQF